MFDVKFIRHAAGASVAVAALTLAGCAVATPASDMRKAVEFDDANTVQKLISRGVDPNLVDDRGNPMLVVALREKSKKAAAALIKAKNIDFDKTNPAGENALMMAALQGDLDSIKLMVDGQEAEINKKGWAPLHYAATNGHNDVVKYLVDHAAYIDAESPNGSTPLMMAARGGHIETVKLLLDEGADMRLKNQQGMNVIDFALLYNQKEIADGLRSRWVKLYNTEPPAPVKPAPPRQ
ncbi:MULTISPECIES: ankyrin repeat domain-containing protein [Cupriavidus]|uniref:Ankyrin repeat domain-containing protein n=1 Tax=Cupriavidus pauculus TaxID=82633 RepID=A0A5P2H165_9BURK|nr:ankyrin repeat domain-containing protein [Cupriavidus pauculus]QET01528.1 ankyrin repeat domain-containing protein [Cupriavidus pauculus]